MVYQWTKSKSKFFFYIHSLKRNNIYIQIYEKLNNPDREESVNTKTVNTNNQAKPPGQQNTNNIKGQSQK